MGNLWFVLAIGSNVKLANLTSHKFPETGPGVFEVKCNQLYVSVHAALMVKGHCVGIFFKYLNLVSKIYKPLLMWQQ